MPWLPVESRANTRVHGGRTLEATGSAIASPDLATGLSDLSLEGEAATTQKLRERTAMEGHALQTPFGKSRCRCPRGRADCQWPAQAAAKRAEEGIWGLVALAGVAALGRERHMGLNLLV